MVASGAGAFGPDAGMGGSTLEPTHDTSPVFQSTGGAFDLLVWPSSVVPDDPVASTTDMAASHTSVTGKVYVQQRHYPGALMKQTTIAIQGPLRVVGADRHGHAARHPAVRRQRHPTPGARRTRRSR